MDSAARQSMKVGLFVVGLTLTLFASVFVLGGSSEMFESRYRLYGTWADVAGLKEGAIVRLAGFGRDGLRRVMGYHRHGHGYQYWLPHHAGLI